MKDLPHYRYDAQGVLPGRARKPLILFLHGSGECGDDLARVRVHGPPKLFPAHGLDRFIVVSPQCPEGEFWEEAKLEAFMRAAIEVLPADPQRVYVTGLSMGGVGTWNVGTRCPELFAALAPVCGAGGPGRAEKLVAPERRGIWLFHSAADGAMAVEGSDLLFEALKAVDADVTYTRYGTLDHGQTWERAYGSTLLYDWFLQHPR